MKGRLAITFNSNTHAIGPRILGSSSHTLLLLIHYPTVTPHTKKTIDYKQTFIDAGERRKAILVFTRTRRQPRNIEPRTRISGHCSSSVKARLKSDFVCCNEVSGLVFEDRGCFSLDWSFYGDVHDQNWLLYDKVTVLESEKRAWENSPEAQAVRDALNPWKHLDAERTKKS